MTQQRSDNDDDNDSRSRPPSYQGNHVMTVITPLTDNHQGIRGTKSPSEESVVQCRLDKAFL